MNASGLIRTLFLWALFLQSIGQLRPAVRWIVNEAAKSQPQFISLNKLNHEILKSNSNRENFRKAK